MNPLILYSIIILVGYLLGSINPAYILGRILKGIDIRSSGTKNAGTRNVKKVLGIGPAIVTGFFDFSKGLLSMFIAWKLGAPEIIIYGAGYAAVLGHIFPFYLGFRGGEGSATGVAILLFLMIKAILNGWFSYEIFIPLAVLALSIQFITNFSEIVGTFTLPAFALLLLLKSPSNLTVLFIVVIIIQLFIVTLYNIKKLHLINWTDNKAKLLHWRTLARPLALIIIIGGFYIEKNIILYVVGAVALVFIILDLLRLLVKSLNLRLFQIPWLLKEKEKGQFSSMTFFLTAIFILIMVFPQNIAAPAMIFIIFGDLFAKFFGLLYGKTPFLTKSLQGSIAYFAFSFFGGWIVGLYLPLPIWILFLGALSASVTESLTIFGIDDNFTVALISASVMLALTLLT